MADQRWKAPAASDAADRGNFEARQPNTLKSKRKRPSKQQAWRKRNPKSYLAHLTIQNALRLGIVERAPCSACGDPKSEAHHPDYDRPLEVVWLCRKHHKAAHRKGRNK